MIPEYQQVRRLFDRLTAPEPTPRRSYSTAQLHGDVRLGKSQTGKPCLVLSVRAEPGHRQVDRHYSNLQLRHHVGLRLESTPGVTEFSVVECVSSEPAIQDWFLRLVPTLIEGLSGAGAVEQLDVEVARIGELFRLADAASPRALPGLWGELATIVGCSRPVDAVAAWHQDERALHDFTSHGFHCEVKTTEGGGRRHHFTTAQLQPPGRVLVVSLVVEGSDDGESILDLYENVVRLLEGHEDLQHKVHRQVMATVGRNLALAEEFRCDLMSALTGARIFLGDDVPQIAEPFPAGVHDVRFSSDLASVTPLSPEQARGVPLWQTIAALGNVSSGTGGNP